MSNSSQATTVQMFIHFYRHLYFYLYVSSPELKVVYTCHYLKYRYTEYSCELYIAIEAIQNKPLL